jgi:hypothetical protein
MRTYTVHEQPNPPADRIDRAEKLVFIKEGFSWPALVFAPIWLLLHRLWWPLLGYVVLSVALQVAQKALRLDPDAMGLVMFGVNLLVAFEADALRRWSLERKGWHTLATVSGRTAEDAERRFFDGWLPSQPIITPTRDATIAPRRKWPMIGGLLGAKG